MKPDRAVIYWDASALLSVLIKDEFTQQARKWAGKTGVHLLSTLAYAETCAVLSRLFHERKFPVGTMNNLLKVLESGPWRRVNIQPDWKEIKDSSLSSKLRGADLWHLTAAIALQKDLPDLFLLTFDRNLREAAKRRGL